MSNNNIDNLKFLSKKTFNNLSKWLDSNLLNSSESVYKDLTEEEVAKIIIDQGEDLESYIIKKEYLEYYNNLNNNVKIILKYYSRRNMQTPKLYNIDLSNPFEFEKYCKKINYNLVALRGLMNSSALKIEHYRCNPLVVYYGMTADITKTQLPFNATIIDSDYREIEEIINQPHYQDKQEIDILLHTMGGDVSISVKILLLLRKRFKKINLIVPHGAKSAGTLMACAADEIIVSDSPVFSQTTPLLYGENTYTIRKNFLLMHTLGYIFNHDGYRKKFGLSAKKKAIEAEESIKKILNYFLMNYALKCEDKSKKAKKIIQRLTDFEIFYSHELCIPSDELRDMGMNIIFMESDLKKLIYEQTNIIEQIMKIGNVSKIISGAGESCFSEIIEVNSNKVDRL